MPASDWLLSGKDEAIAWTSEDLTDTVAISDGAFQTSSPIERISCKALLV